MSPMQQINRVATIAVLIGAACILGALFQLMLWASDRHPPFTMTAYTAPPVKAGQSVIVKAKVIRELDRDCSVTYSRMLFDSSGSRFDITPGAQLMTAEALEDLNRRSPNSLVFSVVIPPQATPGVGALITVMNYVCNPIHKLYPVSVLMTVDVPIVQ